MPVILLIDGLLCLYAGTAGRGQVTRDTFSEGKVTTPHRVVNASGRERYSIPVFYDPDYDVVVECLPNSSAANPPKYPSIVAGDYITARYDGSYAYRQNKAFLPQRREDGADRAT